MTENYIALWGAMFLLMTALDFVWAQYSQACVERNPYKASILAVLIYALGAFGVLGYSHDWTLLIPACAGAYVGTFLATRKKEEA